MTVSGGSGRCAPLMSCGVEAASRTLNAVALDRPQAGQLLGQCPAPRRLRGMTLVPISQLKFFPGNARRGDIDLIADSLKRLGQYKPVVVNKGTHAPELAHVICAGNHTVMAAQRLGWDEVDVHWVDVDADTAKRITLVDNKANDAATYDVEELLALLDDLPDLDATGFTQSEVDALLEAIEGPGEDDELPDDLPADAEGFDLLVECDNADQRDTLKAKLLAEGFNVGNA